MSTRRLTTTLLALVVGLAGLLGVMPTANAATVYTWTGAGGNSAWTNAGNWSPVGVPGTGDSAIIRPIPERCSARPIDVPAITLKDLTLDIGNLCGAAITSTNTLSISGSFTWISGDMNVPVHLLPGSDSTFVPDTGGTTQSSRLKALNETMTVAGTLRLANVTDASPLRLRNPHTITVTETGTLVSTGDSNVTFTACCVNPARVVNNGVVRVDSGTLEIDAVAFDQNKTLTVAPGATLLTHKGPVTATNSSATGGGRWVLGGRNETTFTGTVTLGSGFTLDYDPAGWTGKLLGTYTLAGPGTMLWNGGDIRGAMTVAPETTVRASGAVTGNGERRLHAAAVTVQGRWLVDGGAGWVNDYDPSITVVPGGELRMDTGTVVRSQGTITNSGGTLTVTKAAAPALAFDRLSYAASGGTTAIPSGAELVLANDRGSSLTATTVTGGGTLAVTSPVALSGASTVGADTQLRLDERGSLSGSGALTGPGNVRWTGGDIQGAITVSASGGTTLEGTTARVVPNADGSRSSVALTSGVRMTDGASLDVGTSGITAGGRSTSAGKVTIVGTGGYTQSSGSLALRGGTLTATRVTLAKASLTGRATIAGRLVNQRGQVSPGGDKTGTLKITKGYTQAGKGELVIDVDAKGNDRLVVGGKTVLRGTVVGRTKGSFKPGKAMKRTIVQARKLTLKVKRTRTTGRDKSGKYAVRKAGKKRVILVWRKR